MRRTPADRKDALIAEMIAARASILELVRRLIPAQREAACIGTWTVSDLLAHLIGWDYTNRQAVEEIISGQRPGFFEYYDKDWQTYNARLVALYRKEDFAALVEAAEESHRGLITYLQALEPKVVVEGKTPPGQGRTVTIRNLLQAEAKDERDHASQVAAFFALASSRSDLS